jgi:hypothetical protein
LLLLLLLLLLLDVRRKLDDDEMVLCLTSQSENGDERVGQDAEDEPVDELDGLGSPLVSHIAVAIDRSAVEGD